MPDQSISLRITQLQKLHSQNNVLLMEAKKLYIPVLPAGVPAETGVVKLMEATQLAIENEIDSLRKSL